MTVLVAVPCARAFEVFTQEIDAWWRRGIAFRPGGRRVGTLHLEAKLGGRVFESYDDGAPLVTMGRITCWEPPARVTFEWSKTNFAPNESTEVDVTFEPSPSGTRVTVEHRGWKKIRADHPARHGKDDAAFLAMTGRWWADLLTSLRVHVLLGE